MSNIQYDYSTYSTSISQGEVGSNLEYSFVDNSDVEDDTSSEDNSVVTEKICYIPPDRYRLVYLTFGLLGLGTLLPWNFFITANDYWMYKFRDVANGSHSDPQKKTDLQASFTSYLALTNMVPYVVFLVISTFINNKFSQFWRIAGSLIILVVLFIIFTILVKINTDNWQRGFLQLIMLLVVFASIGGAVLQAAASGVASVLPPQYMHVMVLGQALAGIFASVAQISALLGHTDSTKSALVYFLCADVSLLITLISFVFIHRTNFLTFYLKNSKGDRIMKDVAESEAVNHVAPFLILKMVWPFAVSILLDFWVTLAVFPAITVLVVSEDVGINSLWTRKLFLPVCCFLLFNLSDFCGRAVGGWLPLPSSCRLHLLFLSILRIAFIPLFMLCNAYPRSLLPVVFTSDIYFITFIVLLGLTNGYFVTVAMISGTKFVSPHLQGTAGVVLSTFLGAGLMMGSITSYLLVQLL